MEGALAVMMVVVVAHCGAVPTSSPSQEDFSKAQAYLSQFFSDVGVSAPNTVWRSSLDSFDDTLRKMQEYFGLEVTGQLDANTMEVMARPRCGFTDVTRYSHFDGEPKWEKPVVTYRITNYTPDLFRRQVDATLAKALKVYSDVIPLDFKQIYSGVADIMIMFKPRDHGDFAPFDGEGGILAHAFSPGEGKGGDTHFDEDERWTLTSEGTNLFLVAAHEFGHALGLGHSKVETALMYPTYSYVNTDGYALPDDDRRGVQAIYGVRDASAEPMTKPAPPTKPDPTTKPDPPTKPEPTTKPDPPTKPDPTTKPDPDPRPTIRPAPKPQPTPEPTPEPTEEPFPDRCSRHLMFDAATSIKGNLYFFKDKYFWKKSRSWDGVSMRRIKSVWPGIDRVDATYEYKNSAFFFEGNQYWEVRRTTVMSGYPKPLSDFGFPSSVTKVDAAVHVPFIGRTLFFVRNKYWSYNERRGRMDGGYPKFIYKELPGVGFRVDAVFRNRAYLYFTYGSRQIEYHYQRRRVIRTLLNNGWMDCD